MGDSRYSYDENAEVWPYFAITLLGVVTLPLTAVAWSRSKIRDPPAPPDKEIGISAQKSQTFARYRRDRSHKPLWCRPLPVFVFVGWACLVWLCFKAATAAHNTADSSPTFFDPYEILELGGSETEKQIRSKYRKMSLKFHPDKIRSLPNTTREQVEAQYVQITKAYKALTDEVTRENYLRYGHPDGPQASSHGIALPKFLVESRGSPIIVSLYAVFVGIVLPWFVGSWWANARRYTKGGLHNNTAAAVFELFSKEQPQFVTAAHVLQLVSEATEFQTLIPGSHPSQIQDYLLRHMSRTVFTDTQDEQKALLVVTTAVRILQGVLEIASAFQDLQLCERILTVQRCLLQAVRVEDISHAEILQLPSADQDSQKDSGVWSLLSLSSPSASKQSLGPLIAEAKRIPRIVLGACYFSVPGENGTVPTSSKANLAMKFLVRPSCEEPLTRAQLPKECTDHDPEPTDPDELQNPTIVNAREPELPLVYLPRYPLPVQPGWMAFLVAVPTNKMVDGPVKLSRADVSALGPDKAALSKLVVSRFRFGLQATAPVNPGKISFKLRLLNTCYFGADASRIVEMEIVSPENIGGSTDPYDVSDTEDDPAAPDSQGKKSRVKDDDSDLSDDDWSDYDTDTDVEDTTK